MNYYTVLGIYDHVDTTAATIQPLEELNIPHADMKVLSVAPYPDGTFFRDETPIPMWRFALVGGILGFCLGVALFGGTQVIMNLNVGAKAPFSFPAVGVLTYELTLLGAVLGTLIGMFWMIGIPNWTDRVYDMSISYGNIGLLVRCWDQEQVAKVEKTMARQKAVKIKKGENDF